MSSAWSAGRRQHLRRRRHRRIRPVPDDLADAARAARDQLVEAVAETDDELIERYLSGEEISTQELVAIRAGVREGRLFPVVCAASKRAGWAPTASSTSSWRPFPHPWRPRRAR